MSIPALRGQRNMELGEFKASLLYIDSSRPTRVHSETLFLKIKRNPFSSDVQS